MKDNIVPINMKRNRGDQVDHFLFKGTMKEYKKIEIVSCIDADGYYDTHLNSLQYHMKDYIRRIYMKRSCGI